MTNPTYAEELAEAATETRDSWRTLAVFLMQTSTPQLPDAVAEAYELLQNARTADEDLADMLAHPAHYGAERQRIAAFAERGSDGFSA